MARSMHLYLDSTSSGPTVTRRCRIERRDGERAISAEALWYSLPASAGLPSEGDGEPYLLACLMLAMMEGRSLFVHGEVSRTLLANLTEFRDAWCCWLPQEYQPIDFEPDAILDAMPLGPRDAAIAFTGGVDSAFSVWRHVSSQAGYRSYHIRRSVLVHGFDIALADEASFATAEQAAERTLSDVGLPLLAVRTNFQAVVRVNWEHVHAAAVVSALHFCKGDCGVAILGSTEPYSSPVAVWGSNPTTDHLLSSASMEVVHDGAAFTRVEKIAAIAEWRVGCENLRVCWQGDHRGGNCGRCEKCQRTAFDFLCNRLPVPDCLPQKIDLELLRSTAITSPITMSEWGQVLATAKGNGLDERWMRIVEAKLRPRGLHGVLDALSARRSGGR
jgi:hypothetical protein